MWLVKPPRWTAERGWDRAEIWWVEVKAGPKEPLNDNEEAMRQLIESAGGQYIIVRSVDDAERLLRR